MTVEISARYFLGSWAFHGALRGVQEPLSKAYCPPRALGRELTFLQVNAILIRGRNNMRNRSH
jgi:hypothetical protein